ncbi:MAG: sugar transferase [Bacteroidales bacterium]|jgi:lipopolysaccharide/colanic/teichoic acid biosynthesis glycosyltransferase
MFRRTTFTYALFDLFSVSLIFAVFLRERSGSFVSALDKYLYSFFLFLGIWFLISLILNKYNFYRLPAIGEVFRKIFLSNVLILGIATTLMFMVRIDFFSRTVVLGTILVATGTELLWATLDFYLRNPVLEPPEVKRKRKLPLLKAPPILLRKEKRRSADVRQREEAILVEINQFAFDFIFSYARIDSPETLIISTISRLNIDTQLKHRFESIVNLKRINDIRYLNKFFESANAKLPVGGLFIDFAETKDLRKKRILRKYPPVLNYIAYFIDFIIKRIFPKFSVTKGLYFFLTRGQNRVFTKAETFGRLYSCGFEVIAEKYASNHLFFVARKITKPHYPENPTYGPFIRLERVGYKGRTIRVFKLRTMHPYAEYLQEYVYDKEGLQEGGKFKSDFRVSSTGRFLRSWWLDELPMIINLLKRDLKLVGVRPLSKHYFSLYSKKLQDRRIKYRPGLIPPFYADNPKTLEEIMESELRYMDAYDRHPVLTDIRYFFKAVFNIIFRRYRSK